MAQNFTGECKADRSDLVLKEECPLFFFFFKKNRRRKNVLAKIRRFSFTVKSISGL
jgi:hypothetical protein